MEVRESVSYEVALRLVELSPGICCVFNREGRIEYANAEMKRVLGYSGDDIRGLAMSTLIHPCDRKLVETALGNASSGMLSNGMLSSGREFEARVRTSNGAYKRLGWSLVPDGDRIFGRAEDNSESNREDSYTVEEHEAHILESIGVLAGGIAHDFNNLLTAIIGNASLASQDLPRGDPARRRMEDVITAGQRAADLTQQLLAYAGKGRLAVSALNLSAVVAEILQPLREQIPQTVELALELPAQLPPIEADARQVQQIAFNLVMNALEAVEGEGVIRVSTGHVQLGEQDAETGTRHLPRGEYVYFQVEDTGTGMDEYVKSRIFDPFYTTKFTGRGLGLAAVSGFVRAHGGAIQLLTAPGQGSTFRVLLPVTHRTAEVPRPRTQARRDLRGRSAAPAVWERPA